MLAQSLYSHKELHKKNTSVLHDMCMNKGFNWSQLIPVYKNGTFLYKKDVLTDFDLLKNTDETNEEINYILYGDNNVRLFN